MELRFEAISIVVFATCEFLYTCIFGLIVLDGHVPCNLVYSCLIV